MKNPQVTTILNYNSEGNMKNIFLILIFVSILLIPCAIVSAASPYAKIDVYYNGILYSGDDTPKPFLKIGEPFTLRFDVTSFQRCYLSVELWSIDSQDFVIIDGPTLELEKGIHSIIEKNETKTYEWTVAPTENWAGGSIPINFYYQFTDLDTVETITKGEFTAAYITVSEEYYDGAPAEVSTETTTEDPAKAPGFMLPLAIGMLLLAGKCRRNT